ncbi:MAG: SDR family NAD(P)-dependent oxidoreductase, partial [Pseudonocardiaceae bacterium]
MSSDQYTSQDPTRQYAPPDTDGSKIDYPGQTGAMQDKPDHGENSYRGSHRLDDRAAVITGGDSGIGRAVALAFAREGADVAISYLPSEQEDAQQTARLVEDAGRRAVTVPVDLVEEQECHRLIDRTVQEFGRIDILVNNAALALPTRFPQISAAEWRQTLEVNLTAPFLLTQAVLPAMKAQAYG